MWVFSFEAPKGKRVFKKAYFSGISTDSDLWFSYKTKAWVSYSELCEHKGGGSTHDNRPRSFKAFKKYLNKHTELQQAGIEVVLVSRYYVIQSCGTKYSFSITATWVEE